MELTPFKRLIQNINKITFECDEQQKPEFKRSFCRMFDRLDKYFIKNNLYSVVDYDYIVDGILKPGRYTFYIDSSDLEGRNWAGVHKRVGDKRAIGLSLKYYGKDKTTEGVLCHEFIHALTVGPEVLKYTKDNMSYETQLPQHTKMFVLGGMKRNLTTRKADALDAGDALDGGFICEALTELTKQEIYSQEECYHSYLPQTSLIKFLNNLTGTKINIQDFLRGDLPNYVQAMGRQNFIKFNDFCEKFQEKFEQNARIDYLNDPDYLAAQDTMCKSILQNIQTNPEKYSIEQVLNVANTILTQSPTIAMHPEHAQRYKNDIVLAFNAVTRAQQNLNFPQKQKFSLLLSKTLSRKSELDKTIFTLPNNNLFSFKKTEDGFVICVHGQEILNSNKLPNNYASALLIKFGVSQFKAELDKTGIYKISFLDKDKNLHTIQFSIQKTDNSQTIVLETGENKQEIFINKNAAKEQQFITTNNNLLANFEHFDAMKQILSKNKYVYDIRVVNAGNGQKYLVATTNGNAIFYKITSNGYELIDVTDKQEINEGTKVCERVYLNKEGTSTAFLTKDNTTQGDKLYVLSDGITFVRYYGETGKKEEFAEQIKPFSTNKEIIVICDNTCIYNKNNPDIVKSLDLDNQTTQASAR